MLTDILRQRPIDSHRSRCGITSNNTCSSIQDGTGAPQRNLRDRSNLAVPTTQQLFQLIGITACTSKTDAMTPHRYLLPWCSRSLWKHRPQALMTIHHSSDGKLQRIDLQRSTQTHDQRNVVRRIRASRRFRTTTATDRTTAESLRTLHRMQISEPVALLLTLYQSTYRR